MSTVFVQIRKGKIINTKAISEAFKLLKDGSYVVDINSSKKRSSVQNAYLWGCVYPMAKHAFNDIGYDEVQSAEDVHDIFKSLFIKKHMENKEGLIIEYTGSTKKLSTLEFNEYIDRIAKFCAENLNTVIPMPNEQIQIFQP